MIRKILQTLKYFALSILALFIVWFGYSFFASAKYKPLSLEQYNARADYAELRGAVHMHSNYTDGAWEPEQIHEQMKDSRLDFLVLTDWGMSDEFAVAEELEGRKPIFIICTERSTSTGHILGYGLKSPIDEISDDPLRTIELIRNAGGLPVVAHPFRRKNGWSDWDVGDFGGIELINFSEIALNLNRGRAIFLIPRALFNLPGTLMYITDYPAKNFNKWDEMNREGKAFGFFGVDAHGPKYIGFIKYESILPSLNIHIPYDKYEPEQINKETINQAIRGGHFYNCVDGLAQSEYFDFRITIGSLAVLRMGDEFNFVNRGSINFLLGLKLAAPKGAFTRIYRDGLLIKTFDNAEGEIVITEPGVYRAEVWIREADNPYGKNKIWIVSNPIYLREAKQN